MKNTAAVDAALIALKKENKEVQQKLDDSLKVIVQKDLKIQDLETTNQTLAENIFALQQIIAAVHN